jgi:hypothetical protein
LPAGKVQLAAAGCIVLLFAVFLFAPIVPYSQRVSLPRNQVQLAVAGYATPAYRVLGYGDGPFPDRVLAVQGDHSALLFFNGTRLVAAEDTGQADVRINPQQTVYIQQAIVASADYGLLNISVTLKSYDLDPIVNPLIYVSMQGFSSNQTNDGVTWIVPRPLGSCGQVMPSGAQCTVSQVVDNNLPVNRSFYFSVEVRGTSGGGTFLARQGYTEQYPAGGVGPRWLAVFLGQVQKARTGPALVENSTLDAFARIRFDNASAHYQISDWGFSNDSVRFLGLNRSAISDQEVLLYPLNYSPTAYAAFLQKYAPGHWFALINGYYSQFGYFISQGPVYKVSVPCPVYEIPHSGLDIKQFFADQGCTTSLAPSTWLVIVLTP